MADLGDILGRHVRDGAVALVVRGGGAEVAAVGSASAGGAPMARDSIFRIASITKPVTAASVMMLVDEGRIALDDPVGEWLPELAKPSVVRTPASEVDDVVPATRPITVFDLLTSRAGYRIRVRLHAAGRAAAVSRAEGRPRGAELPRAGRVDG